jgi:hypothetical protein
MAIRYKTKLAVALCVLGIPLFGITTPVQASDAGAFIGGVFATKLLGNMERRTAAEEAQAAAAQQPRYYRSSPAAAPAPTQKSAEQRIAELDKLAAGGYITPEEYKSKKQKIIDGL